MSRFVYILLVILGVVCATSCKESEVFGDGEGTLSLKISMQNDLPIISAKTRATLTDEELLNKCRVYIRNSEGLIRKFASLDEMPDRIQLVPNTYRAEATAGDSVAASFTNSYFKGTKEFAITKGQTVSSTIKCLIQNTVVDIKLSDELKEAFSEYKITVSNRMGKLIYTPDSIGQLGYFMLLDDENQLKWNFVGKVKGSNAEILKSGVVNLVKRSTKYELTFSNNPADTGGGMISVSVNETALISELDVQLMARPVIKVIENNNIYELDNPVYRGIGDKSTSIIVRMAASVPFDEIKITSNDFARLGINKFYSFDVKGLTSTQIRELDGLGFSLEFNADTTKVQFTFKENLREKMTANIAEGDDAYRYVIEVKDRNAKMRTKTLTVITTEALVATEDIPSAEKIWSTKATLYGSLVAASAPDIKFQYRKVGLSEWSQTTSPAVISNKIFTCELTGLTPGTQYEYQAMSKSVAATSSKFFFTESALQLFNAGFEDWHQSGKILYIYKSGGDMFWDSGNTGSSTLSKNVTTNDGSIKHGGNYSAKLQSQFVGVIGIGAFAAGNIYIGKFLKVDGTDGILRFGRPWDSRPSALKLYYKYNCGTVDYSKLPEFPTGRKDIGIVYIALGDWPHQTAEGESDIPVLVKTKAEYRQLFDPNSSNVIAYGEYPMEASTEEDGMVEITIPIKYRSNRKPTDIIVVGSASKYGDYFTGSTGSTMWLDDLELIYEDVEFEK